MCCVDPRNPSLQAVVGARDLPYIQFYTPLVKAMEERVPLASKPNLLTYLLGEGYMSGSHKFRTMWQEVDTQRTKHELLEAVHPTVPMEARPEVVLSDSGTNGAVCSLRHQHGRGPVQVLGGCNSGHHHRWWNVRNCPVVRNPAKPLADKQYLEPAILGSQSIRRRPTGSPGRQEAH